MKRSLIILTLLLGAFSFVYADTTSHDCGSSAQVTITPTTGYHFVNWSDGNTDNPRVVVMDNDYHLTANIAINQYTIIFQNDNGDELQSEVLNHGDAVSYKGETPTKPSTTQYSYTFAGWSPTINPTASANATYTATFDPVVNKYTITFKNFDGTVLQSNDWDYGATPVYSSETPTKPADAGHTYTFTGWDKTISAVTGTEEYIAQFSSATKTYTLTTTGEHGTTTGDGTYQYGTSHTITASPDECYEFVRWSDGNTNATRTVTITGNVTYTAIFQKVSYTLSVDVNDASHATIEVVEL